MSLFLQEAVNFEEFIASGSAGPILAAFAGFMVFAMIAAIAVYIYGSFAFSKISDKTKIRPSWLAWIPVVGKPLLASKIAKKHWWPVLFLAGIFIPYVGNILLIVFAIFFVIWMWKMFESVGRPGWWAIFYIIPILNIVWLVFIGLAAWGEPAKPVKDSKAIQTTKTVKGKSAKKKK